MDVVFIRIIFGLPQPQQLWPSFTELRPQKEEGGNENIPEFQKKRLKFSSACAWYFHTYLLLTNSSDGFVLLQWYQII